MTYFLYLLLILFFFTFLSESTHHPKNSWEEHFVIWTKWFFLSCHVAAVHFSGIFFQMVLNSRKFHSSSTYFQTEINVYLNLRHSSFVTEKNWENREANGEPKWQRSCKFSKNFYNHASLKLKILMPKPLGEAKIQVRM